MDLLGSCEYFDGSSTMPNSSICCPCSCPGRTDFMLCASCVWCHVYLHLRGMCIVESCKPSAVSAVLTPESFPGHHQTQTEVGTEVLTLPSALQHFSALCRKECFHFISVTQAPGAAPNPLQTNKHHPL